MSASKRHLIIFSGSAMISSFENEFSSQISTLEGIPERPVDFDSSTLI
jgi:hypothetical protein